MLAIWKKEVQAYYLSPIAYVFTGVFMLVSGLFFTLSNILSYNASFIGTLSSLTFLFMLVVPILTMRLLSEERLHKTDQLLLTAPVSLTAVVVGKYLAALTVFAVTLLVSGVYPLVLMIFGNPAVGEIMTGYVGFFLLGAAIISVGVFMSSLTESQVTAAVTTFGILLFLQLIEAIVPSLDAPWLITAFQWISIYYRFETFSMGLLSLVPSLYYISFVAVFLFLTIRVMDRRRWSEE